MEGVPLQEGATRNGSVLIRGGGVCTVVELSLKEEDD